ncbi:uncharacterized protein LOC111600007 [Drosophila hydei]|uniref:Uncharacterized protein LOC111600007 n=1 Tax=Drosophila hydei TaxID=7224 RepID=A0A6J2SYM3_DROHY|nr:uncharacterized protein LOC111600007 [Drosophila hydei]
MRLAVANRCVLWKVALLLAVCGVAAAHPHAFLGVCMYDEVMVDCVPSCQKICSGIYVQRKCDFSKCLRGCVCPKGWVRMGSTAGECMKRNTCMRWII